jgi:hypothetical protein
MITESYLVRGSKLTDNQKRFLTDQGCKIEPFISLNSWLEYQGYSITISDSRARTAWELIRNPDDAVTRIYDYTKTERIPLGRYGADLTIVDEVNTIPNSVWDSLKTE